MSSLLVPLTVRLSNASAQGKITRRLRNLSFRSVCPGGYASATFALSAPLDTNDPALAAYTDVVIEDAHTGEVVWQGKLEDPGRGAGSDGEVWDITAMGPSARAQDQTLPLIYLDRDWTKFQKTAPSDAGALAQVESDPSGATETEMLKCQFPAGQTIVNQSKAMATYDAILEAGMTIGAYGVQRIGGKTDANYSMEIMLGDGTTLSLVTDSGATLTVAGGNSNRYVIDDFVAGYSRLSLRLRRTAGGAHTVPDDLTWGAWYNVRVIGRRYRKTGVLASGNAEYSTSQVFASEIVADLLGRCLTTYDGTNATVATTAQAIDQLAYPDGITPAQVFDDLMALEPAYYWAAWEGTPSRFEWAAWPSTVSYNATVLDGYSAPSSTTELFNAVMVRWRNSRGRLKTTQYTSTVGTLSAAGLTRTAFVDLGDEIGSTANAARVGANFLADHAYPANAGTLTISRPLMNLQTGRIENPWQIRPGRLVRVRGVQASPDALNATSPNGVTVLRIVATDYNADSNSVVCELDSYSRALARSLARADRQRRR